MILYALVLAGSYLPLICIHEWSRILFAGTPRFLGCKVVMSPHKQPLIELRPSSAEPEILYHNCLRQPNLRNGVATLDLDAWWLCLWRWQITRILLFILSTTWSAFWAYVAFNEIAVCSLKNSKNELISNCKLCPWCVFELMTLLVACKKQFKVYVYQPSWFKNNLLFAWEILFRILTVWIRPTGCRV